MAKTMLFLSIFAIVLCNVAFGRIVNKRKCPEVRAVPHFDLSQMLGDWFVVEYYASAEEALSYSCMRAVFTEDDHVQAADGSVEWTPGVTMNFTYRFADDPLGENLLGNITWRVDLNEPAHWTHSELTYDGVYNTYVLDTEYKTVGAPPALRGTKRGCTLFERVHIIPEDDPA
ncbi:unnamed protein product, partial [Iphiclides podalirius]